MNKKVLLVLLISVFSLTGCSAKCEMEIKNGKITENISISIPNEYSDKKINDLIEYYGVNNNSSFKQKITKSGSIMDISLTGKTEKLDSFFNDDDSFIKKCYNKISFLLEDGNYYIGTSKGFNCLTYDYMELDKISISIKTYNKVYDNNADDVKGNIYTWNINRSNVLTHSMMFVVSKNDYVWYYKYRYLFGGLIAVGSLFMLIYLIYLTFKSSSNRANKI